MSLDPQIYHLSPRELDVLRLVTEGLSDQEIALRLGISSNTASRHLASIREKMGTRSRTETAVRAIRQGLVSLLASVVISGFFAGLAGLRLPS